MRRGALSGFLLFVMTVPAASVRAQPSAEPHQRLDEHARARTLADELVSNIFEIQLRHLEANGLQALPVYQEIVASRDNIRRLASTEMDQLAQLLEQLHRADASRRGQLLGQARGLARQIAVAMMAERQRLRARLRTSRTSILVRQMIALVEQAIVATQRLESLPAAERRSGTEQLVQTHLDLAVLHDQLTAMLQQVAETVGPDRIGALAALEHLQAEKTKWSIENTVDQLRSGSAEQALNNEQLILAALEEVDRLLQQGAELEQEARREALEAIARTMHQQRELLRRTEASPLADAKQREDLAAEQRHIVEQLEQLAEPLGQLAQVGEQMLAAVDAARQAGQHLAQGKQAQAIERQETVLNMLDDVARHLNAEAIDPDTLADRAAQLEALNTSLNDLLEKQAEASRLAGDDPAAAAELEQAIGDELDEADDASRLDDHLETRLDEAQEAVKKAQQVLEDDAPAAAQSRLEAVENAEQALLEAAAEAQSQLADTQQAMEANRPSESNPPSDSASKSEATSGTTRDSAAAGTAEPAVDIKPRSFENEAWFTGLPAELQNRIRAATRRPPPRGYETRLQRYFLQD